MANYKAVTQQAQNVAATPYTGYTGSLVAPINGQQSAGIGAVNNASGIQNGYNAGATGLAAASSANIAPTQFSGSQLQQFENPYQSDVINATEAELQNQNQQQSAALTGNAVSAGAFGGDRAGVAQAALAGQQAVANNATIAGLNTANFQNAESEFNTQQATGLSAAQNTAARQLAASQQIGNLGNTAQTEALTEANAQTNAGTLEQTTQQAQDTAAYNQFLQQQAYPFQTTGWLANIVEGIGSQSGGTSTGQQTQSGGSGASQIAGGLLSLGSMFLASGGRVKKASGGGLALPYEGAVDPSTGQPVGLGGGSYVTPANLAVGHTMPQGTQGGGGMPSQPTQAQSMAAGANGVKGLSNAFENSSLGDAFNDFTQDNFGFAKGGLVRPKYDNGGSVSPDALWTDAENPHGTGPVLQPNDVTPLTAAAKLPTPEAALAAQYGNQMPAPQQDGITPEQRLAVAMGAPMPASGSAPPAAVAGPVGLAPDATPDSGLAKLRTAMGGTDPAKADPNAAYGGLGDLNGLAVADKSAPLPPVRPVGLGSAPSTLETVAPGGLSPVAASAPMQLAGAGLAGDTSAGAGVLSGVNPDARGMRNNNPGNLESNAWTQSLPGYVGTDGRFAIFSSPQAGMAALDRNLQGYGNKGISTPLQIASTWAPGSEQGNNPLSYGAVIAKTLGVGVNDPVNMADPATRAKIGQAIAFVENGPGKGLASAPAAQAIEASAGAPTGLARGQIAAPAYSGEQQLTASSPVASSDASPNSGNQGGGGLLGLHLSDAARQGMLAAGLGMMAGTSRSGLVNIGQGGLQGLAAYNNARKLQSDVGLQGAQTREVLTKTQGADIENKIKQKQLDFMMGALDGHEAAGTQKADAVAAATTRGGITTPTVTAPTVAPQKVVDPNYDPDRLNADAARMAVIPGMSEAAKIKKDQAAAILSGNQMVHFTDGSVGYYPGTSEAKAGQAGQIAGAQEAAKSGYNLVDVQPTPGGPTYKVPKSTLLSGPGAGSPPGATMDAAATVNPNVAKQPEFYAEKQKAIAADESDMVKQFQARQLSRQRLQALSGILQAYQPGAFAQQKADLVAALRGVGINAPDTATANPAAFQEFVKNATANVFNDVKSMGGKVLVSEIAGLTKANANPELQPAAAAAIIGQGLGVLDYEDQHTQDYFDWKKNNPNAVNTSEFELPWAKQHPVSQYVSNATKGIAFKGQDIPAPEQRTSGQTYMTPKGPMVWAGRGWRPAAANP